jgi:hypothetical protein
LTAACGTGLKKHLLPPLRKWKNDGAQNEMMILSWISNASAPKTS